MSKRGSGSSARIPGFTSRESNQIARILEQFRKTDVYKSGAEQAIRAAGSQYDTTAKLSHSAYYVDQLQYAIAKASLGLDIEYTIKQEKYITDQILKELGSDNPKWKKYRK